MPSGADTLRRAALFESLTAADQQALVLFFRPREYRRGEVVFHEGDPGGFMLVLAEGILSVTRTGRARRQQELARLGPGEMAGEMAFLDAAPRCATVTATTAASAYLLDQDALEVLKQRAPVAARALVRAVLRVTSGRLLELRDRMQAELAS